jgi:hypothetical protein
VPIKRRKPQPAISDLCPLEKSRRHH